jgi:carbonic anhydrase/acetyltransferase-like protein (isoleucine patch superfamily)
MSTIKPANPIARAYSGVLAAVRSVGDSFVPAWLRSRGATIEEGVRFVGVPFFKAVAGSELRIGARTRIVSRMTGNPLLLATPTALVLVTPNARLSIGADAAVSGAIVCVADSVEVGDRCLLGAGCVISDTDFHPLSPEARRVDRNAGAEVRPIRIGDDVFVGSRAVLLKGTQIGDGCTVGAGAVVSGVFPARSIIAGNPAKVVRELPPAESAPGEASRP